MEWRNLRIINTRCLAVCHNCIDTCTSLKFQFTCCCGESRLFHESHLVEPTVYIRSLALPLHVVWCRVLSYQLSSHWITVFTTMCVCVGVTQSHSLAYKKNCTLTSTYNAYIRIIIRSMHGISHSRAHIHLLLYTHTHTHTHIKRILPIVHNFLCTLPRSAAPHTPRVLLLGPTGSGKSLQAAQLARQYRLVNIDCKELIRRTVASGSKLAVQMKPFVERGLLSELKVKVNWITSQIIL